MKIVVVSAGYLPRIRCHRVIEPAKLTFVVHTDESRREVADYTGVPLKNIHVSHCEKGPWGAALQRRWAQNNLIAENEWYAVFDDNNSQVTKVPEPWYSMTELNWDEDFGPDEDPRELFREPCKDVIGLLEEAIDNCEAINTVYGGFATNDNFYFRRVKWGFWSYIETAMAVIRNVGLNFYPMEHCTYEDFCITVETVARYGCVARNNYAKCIKIPYEEGGIGSLEQRRPSLVPTCNKLKEMYPGLLKHVKDRDYDLRIRLRSQRTIDEWRKEHGYL